VFSAASRAPAKPSPTKRAVVPLPTESLLPQDGARRSGVAPAPPTRPAGERPPGWQRAHSCLPKHPGSPPAREADSPRFRLALGQPRELESSPRQEFRRSVVLPSLSGVKVLENTERVQFSSGIDTAA